MSPLIEAANENISHLIDQIIVFKRNEIDGCCPPNIGRNYLCKSGQCKFCRTKYFEGLKKELEQKYLIEEEIVLPEYKDTTVVMIGSTRYCIYCGSEAKLDLERYHPHEHMEDVEHYYCTCTTAQSELEMKAKILNIKEQYLLSQNNEIIKELQYQHELEFLKRRYNK